MRKITFHYWLLILLTGCGSSNIYGETVKISGVVLDERLKSPLVGASVEMYVFKQKSVFSMGSYILDKDAVTDENGRFEFVAKAGDSIQIKTRASGAELYGGLMTLDVQSTEQPQIVIENKER
ncbi:MAG: hypothetical protein Q8L60_02140 [Gammaproteobacteria bacterium]|nr:hypothetical protein [Gammaproteobacteria bacterium]MDP2347675.1 hypothetical protein [Gammaproteobacteria bacterium]